MAKPISRQNHGYTDYNYVATVSIAPKLFDFTSEATAARLCRMLSGGILLSSLFTRAEWGLFRVVPYKIHVAADFATGVFALSAPWIFGFAHNDRARNTFIAMGVTGMVVGLLSEPEEMD